MLSTPDLIQRFQYLALTEETAYYNQTVFRPAELLQSHLPGRRTDPLYWDNLQGRICDHRDTLQITETSQDSDLLQRLRNETISLKTEIKDTLTLNMTHQVNMVRKVNLLIKRIFQLQHALADSQQTVENSIANNANEDMTLHKFFKRISTPAGIMPEIAQSQSSAAKSQKAQTCIFNSND